MHRARSARGGGLRTLSLLFVLSGATGLAYEMVWFKRLSQVFGSSSLALAAVVACFLLGLGAGALVLGRMADRLARPVRAYALCELGVAVLALLLPYELALIGRLAPGLDRAVADAPLLRALLRFALALVVLGPPCFLMGGTLPILTRRLVGAGRALGSAAAWLYALNALGAAAGCLATGFVLLPRLGISTTGLLVVAVNAAIAAGAFALGDPPAERAPAADAGGAGLEEEPRSAPPPPGFVGAAALVSGAAAIGLQIAWTRQLGLVLGGTTYAFCAVLATFILGIGLGSLAFRMLRRGRRVEPWIVSSVLLVVWTGFLGRAALPDLSLAVGALMPLRNDALFDFGMTAIVAVALQGLPTFGMGIVFPALVELYGIGRAAGRAVGVVYAWNTVGSVLGAVLAALVGLPALTAAGTVALGLGLYATLPVLLFPPVRGRVVGLAGGAAAGVALLLPWPASEPLITNFGMYLYGARRPAELREGFRVASFEEGRTCSVLVLEHERGRNLRVNGKVDASDSPEDMVMQLGLACIPRFLRPSAREVLVIGFGSGVTSGASLHWPGTRVTCVEIEPAVLAASRFFHAVNHVPEASDRFRAVVDDGRSYVQRADGELDLILSAPSNPWIAGVANLFTVEFYRTARERLSEGGLLAQWMQVYLLADEEFAGVLRSLRQVFPHIAVARVSDGDTILLASDRPIVPSRSDLDASRTFGGSLGGLRGDLDTVYGTHDVRSLLLRHLVLDDAGVDRLLGAYPHAPPNTDMNLRLEFDAPRLLFARTVPAERDARRAIFAAARAEMWLELCRVMGCGTEQSGVLGEVAHLARRRGAQGLADALVEAGLGLDPENASLLAERWRHRTLRDPEQLAPESAVLVRLDPNAAYALGRDMSQGGDPIGGRIVLEALAEAYPESATVWSSLAIVYESLGLREASRAAIERAVTLDPLNELGRRVSPLIEPAVAAEPEEGN